MKKKFFSYLFCIIFILLLFITTSCKNKKNDSHKDVKEIEYKDSSLYSRYLFHDGIMLIEAEFQTETIKAHGYFYYDKNGKMIAGPFMSYHPFVCGYANADGKIIDTLGRNVTSDDVKINSGNAYKEEYLYAMTRNDAENSLFALVRYDGYKLSDFIYKTYFPIKGNYLVGCTKPNGDIDFINIDGEILNTYNAKGKTRLFLGDKNYFFVTDSTDSDFYLSIFAYDCKSVNTVCIPDCVDLTPYEINSEMIGVSPNDFKGYIMNINGEKIDTPNNLFFKWVLRNEDSAVIVLCDADRNDYFYDDSFNKIIQETYDKISVSNMGMLSKYLLGEKDNLLYLYDYSGKLLIESGKEEFSIKLDDKYTVTGYYGSYNNENVIYAKCGDINYYYDYNYNLLFEISDEEIKEYSNFKVVYDCIMDKYYVSYKKIGSNDETGYCEYHYLCEIKNNQLIENQICETGFTHYRIQNIVNGYLVYSEYDKTVIYDISKRKEVVVIDGSFHCLFYDDYMLFKNGNVFKVYNYNITKICDFVVDNPYKDIK